MKNFYTLCTLLLASSALNGMNQKPGRSRSNSQIILYNQEIDGLQSLNRSLVEIDKAYNDAEKLIGQCNQLMGQCRKIEQHYIDKANAPCLNFKRHLSITGQLCVTAGAILYLGTIALILHNNYCMQNGLSNPLHQSLCGS
jgi:hypothetical protein